MNAIGRDVQPLEKLCRWFEKKDSCLVALSGGVDSSVLAAAAFRVLGTNAIAATVKSELQSEADLEGALRIAAEIGIEHLVLEFGALEVDGIRKNLPDRCYLCKRAIAKRLSLEARSRGIAVVVDGTNASDRAEDRPGMRALSEFGIEMPLRELGITKEVVRGIARELNLSNAALPHRSCLATRIGGEITSERLGRVERAEEILPRDWRITDLGDHAEVRVPEGSKLSEEAISELKMLGYRKVARKVAARPRGE